MTFAHAGDFLAQGFVSRNTVDVTVLGPDEYGRSVIAFRPAFPDLTTTIEDVIAEGDRVVVRGTDRSTHQGAFMGRPATGRPVTSTWIEIFRMEAGRAVEGWLEFDVNVFSTNSTTLRQRATPSPAPGPQVQRPSAPPVHAGAPVQNRNTNSFTSSGLARSIPSRASPLMGQWPRSRSKKI